MRIEKPWGWEEIVTRNDTYVIKILHVDAGKRFSWQYHQKKLETWYLLSGRGNFIFETYEVTTDTVGYCITIRPGEKHRIEGITDVEVLEVSTPELEDVVRLEDDYGRSDPFKREN